MTLEKEIAGGESARLEFKEARTKDSLKYTKTVVSFANGRGGRIVFGVEDTSGKIVGIPKEKVFAEMDAIVDAIANTCRPPVPCARSALKSSRLIPTFGYCFVAGIVASGILEPRIKCGMFRGTAKGDFIDRRTCEGTIVEQVDQAYQFVVRNIRVGSEIVGTGRRDIYELPLSSIREAICNAVFHRDYLEPSSVYVALYDDRLEILSPGELVKGITLEDAKSGFSKLRNHSVGLALEYMKEVEGWGGGVSQYFSDCEAFGLPRPYVGEEAGFFKVVFYRKRSSKDGKRFEPINEPISEALRRMIDAAPGISKPQLVVKIGKSRATVTRALAILCKSGNVEYRGSKKTGGYYVRV